MNSTRWLILPLCVSAAQAQIVDYPTKPIRMIIPFAPGGANDVFGRLAGIKITEALGQQVIVENRGGAGGSIGVELAAKAPADGYTLVLGNIANLSVNPTLYRKLGYNPLTDLQPITLMAKLPSILVVHPSLPAKNVKALIALPRAQPARLTFGTGGGGSGSHLTMELFKLQAKVDLIHVPYKGAGPALADLLAGQTSMMVDNLPSSMQYIKSGKLRALAVTSKNRVAELPDVPTMIQSGYPNFDVTAWFGLFVPAGTPKPIIDKLYAAVKKSLETPEIKQRWKDLGGWAVGDTPANTKIFIAAEKKKWEQVAQQAKIEAE